MILVVVLSVVIGVVSYIGLRFVWPRYDSVVTYEVSPSPEEAFEVTANAIGSGGQEEMEQYMATQAFVMQSEKILKRLVEDVDVQQTHWANKYHTSGGFDVAEAYDDVKDILSARRIPNTKIMTLSVRTRRPNDAMIIASTASTIYLSDVKNREQGLHLDMKKDLEGRLSRLRANISSIDRESENLLARNTITALKEANSVQLNEVRAIQPKLVESRSELSRFTQMLLIYEDMRSQPGGAVFPETIREDVESDPIVINFDSRISSQKSRLRSHEENGMTNSNLARRLRRTIAGEEAERRAYIDNKLPTAFTARIEFFREQISSLTADTGDQQRQLEDAQAVLNQTTLTLQQHEDLQRDRNNLLDRIVIIEERISNQDVLLNRQIRVRILDGARIPDRLAFPQPIPVIGLISVLLPGLVGSLIVLRELREQRVRGPQDVALIPRVRVVGVIPDISMDPSNPKHIEMAARDAPGGVIAECYREIRTSLLRDCGMMGYRSILVFSGMPESGTTSFVSNLALSFAESDTRVLIIDANVRRSKISRLFGAVSEPGLTDVLSGRSSLDQAVQSTDQPNLSLMAPGSRDRRVFERFPSAEMGNLMRLAQDEYEIVLIDAPPAVVSSDALAMARHCDSSLMIVRAYSEKRGLVARLRNQFGDSHAVFMGVVVNGVRASAGGYFKRNFQVTHEYGREAIMTQAPSVPMPEPSANGSVFDSDDTYDDTV